MIGKTIAISVMALTLAFGPQAMAQESPKEVAGATSVDAAAAKALFDRGVKFVDVRGARYYRVAHVPRAVVFDAVTELTEANFSKVAAKDEEIVVYCAGPG